MLKKIFVTLAILAIVGCGGGSGKNMENAKKLKEGMTESEVTTIMGTPSHKEETDMMGNKMVVLFFDSGEPPVTVFMADGKAGGASAGGETLFGKVSSPGK